MNEPRRVQLPLTIDELTLLEAHLRRHLGQIDRELVRTENATLAHAIAGEEKVLEGIVDRLVTLKN